MKKLKLVISIISWAYSALVVWTMYQDHKELKRREAELAEIRRKTDYHF